MSVFQNKGRGRGEVFPDEGTVHFTLTRSPQLLNFLCGRLTYPQRVFSELPSQTAALHRLDTAEC